MNSPPEDTGEQILTLDQDQLSFHPRNMRRIYPPDQVEQMAQSIRERGVLQPLVGIQDEDGITIIIGNLRLTALRSLGDDAPLVPVIVRDRSDENVMLDMATENIVRFRPDPVSEGLHYQRILAQPNMNVNRLHELTGISAETINNRLTWCQFEPEIQELVITKRIPVGAAVPLSQLPPGQIRIQTAARLARARSSLRTIKTVCTRQLNQIESGRAVTQAFQSDDSPSIALATNGRSVRDPVRPLPRGTLRKAALDACNSCPTRDYLGVEEPAWEILSHGARQTCDDCGLSDIRGACNNCPLVICLRHAYRAQARAAGKVPHKEF